MQPFSSIVGTEHVQPPGVPDLDGAKVEAVIRPGSAEEVAACLGAARNAAVRLVARGGGSKLHWGNPPDVDALALLDLQRLDSPPELEPEDGIVTAQAGVTVEALARAASVRGTRTSLEPIFPGATVGGTIAADPVGPAHSTERRLRDDLLGLEVALANGELTRAGGNVVKNVTGFDLVRLYCGSLGTLGVITRATLRLHSAPAARRVLCRDFTEREAALRTAAELLLAPLELGGIAVRPGSGGVRLLWLLEGAESSVAEFARRFEGDDAGLPAWDELCREIGEPEREAASARVRVAARSSDTAEICHEVERLAGARALRLVLPRAGVAFAEIAADRVPELWREVEARQWALFLERRPAGLDCDVFGPGPEALPLMRALKQRFDPDRVLAPGRYVGGI
ncbi:MAG: FAD-binding oxidoreductase [Myxococcota bacterium]